MSPDSAPPTPPAEPQATERGWVWHASLESKAAGKISVLAVVETVLACAGYWWFAFHFDTHWHLLTSILIAPLLLLRSPESIKLGVRRFLDSTFKSWVKWSPDRRRRWLACSAIASGGVASIALPWLAKAWLSATSGWLLLGKCAALLWVGVQIGVAGAVASAGAGVVAGALASAGGVLGVGVVAIVATVLAPGLALGFWIRSLACRLAATILHFRAGWSHLASNWGENNLRIDFTLPAELMPGIRGCNDFFTLEGLVQKLKSEQNTLFRLLILPVVALGMFLPAFLYRLNIKATAWFWWPLAMLLKPVPPEDDESGERDRLTWPWRNPFQKAWIILSIVIALVTLPGHFLNMGELMRSLLPSGGKVEGVPFLVRVAQALGWDGIRPWHWAVAVMAGCSVGMLIIGGRAVQKDENKHWPAYQKAGLRRDLWCMDMLKRLRFLAMLFFWGTGLLALLLETKAIPEKIPLPARQTEALREWFAGDSPVPKGDSPPR